MNFVLKFIPLSILISTLAYSQNISESHYHIVKPGEIFSRIARRHFGKPTYSKHGALAKLIALNPDLENIDFLKPGQRIRLTEELSRPIAAETPTDEVLVNSNDLIFKKYSQIVIHPGFKFVRIDAVDKTTDADALLLSKSFLEFPISWQQIWSKNVATFQRFSLSFAQFDDPGEKTISNKIRIHYFLREKIPNFKQASNTYDYK